MNMDMRNYTKVKKREEMNLEIIAKDITKCEEERRTMLMED